MFSTNMVNDIFLPEIPTFGRKYFHALSDNVHGNFLSRNHQACHNDANRTKPVVT